MRAAALEAFARTPYLADGHAHVLARARPLFDALIARLASLPEDSPPEVRLLAVQQCVEGLNAMGDEIETVERECFCAALYGLGAIVGLNEATQYVDRWRGDW